MPPPIRYQPDERPPRPLAFGLGLQQALLSLGSVALTPIIVIRAAGGGDPYLSWAVFAALFVSGITTALQSARLGRLGAGYPLLMGTSGTFIAVCIAALADGGPALLATLVLVSALFQFLISSRLSWLRRLITPAVGGTVIMLIAVTVMPVIFDLLGAIPAGTSPAAAPVTAGVTLVVIAGLALRASGMLRVWAPLLGLIAGCAAAWFVGIGDLARVAEAAWVGVPFGGWPGLDLGFGTSFWALLPAFVLVTLVGAIETVGDAMGIQRVSWRKPRATDFRAVQGAVAADGVGNVLSGVAATVPNTTYSSSLAITELTGVAARSVGVWIGAVFAAVAFVPKLAALLMSIPNPVAAGYLIVLLSLLFVLGMRLALQDGADSRTAVIVGVSFWIGVGFQNQAIFAEQLGAWWGSLLGNGMAAGGITAILLTLFFEATAPRRFRLETAFGRAAAPRVDDFLAKFASRRGWSEDAARRLRSAGEEALLSLLGDDGKAMPPETSGKRLLAVARGDGPDAEIEFIAALGEGNLEDRLLLLPEQPGRPAEDEVSLRLLRHYASSVRHRQYHGADIITIRVEGSPR